MEELDLTTSQTKTYDSTHDIQKHRFRVSQLMESFSFLIQKRGAHHDKSKLEGREKSLSDKFIPLVRDCVFGSDSYYAIIKDNITDQDREAQKEHYRNNSHHPEHYEQGINGFDLIDLIEAFFDWKAANEVRPGPDFISCLEINRRRFKMSDQLFDILRNTAERVVV